MKVVAETDELDRGNAAWRPDGRTIAFDDRPGSVWFVDAAGGALRPLVVGGSDRYPAWSPDGTTLAYSHDGPPSQRATAAVALLPVAYGALSWAPDGTRLAVRGDYGDTIIVVNLATGVGHAVIQAGENASVSGPAWSPDGSMIAFTSMVAVDPPAYFIRVHELASARERTIGSGSNPAWSPDSRQIVFERGRDIYVVPREGGRAHRLARNALDPSWSPDGTRVVFVSRRTGNRELYAVNADGTNHVRLTRNRWPEFSPDWQSR